MGGEVEMCIFFCIWIETRRKNHPRGPYNRTVFLLCYLLRASHWNIYACCIANIQNRINAKLTLLIYQIFTGLCLQESQGVFKQQIKNFKTTNIMKSEGMNGQLIKDRNRRSKQRRVHFGSETLIEPLVYNRYMCWLLETQQTQLLFIQWRRKMPKNIKLRL